MPRRKRNIDNEDYTPLPGRRETQFAVASQAQTQRVTRLMTTDAARQAVFKTAELLELIFNFLPIEQVLVSQRVCRQFRDGVKTSKLLQGGTHHSTTSEIYSVRLDFQSGVWAFCPEAEGNQDCVPLRLGVLNTAIILPSAGDLGPMFDTHEQTVLSNGGDHCHVGEKMLHTILELKNGQMQSWQSLDLCSPTLPMVKTLIQLQHTEDDQNGRRLISYVNLTDEIRDETGITMGNLVRQSFDQKISSNRTLKVQIIPEHEPPHGPPMFRSDQTLREYIEQVRKDSRTVWFKIIHMGVIFPGIVFLSEEEREAYGLGDG